MIRQLFDRTSCTYTYVIVFKDQKQCAVIDPVYENFERDKNLLTEWGLNPTFTLETHTHADHITSAKLFRDTFNCKIAVSSYCDIKGADIYLKEGDEFGEGRDKIKVMHTPGHTKESLCFLYQDSIFSGDTLLIRGCGRTDFQGGSSEQLYKSVHEKIFTLDGSTKIYPGHDYQGRLWTTVGEEKQHNLRLNKNIVDFCAFMKELGLPEPKKIKEAVPANSSF